MSLTICNIKHTDIPDLAQFVSETHVEYVEAIEGLVHYRVVERGCCRSGHQTFRFTMTLNEAVELASTVDTANKAHIHGRGAAIIDKASAILFFPWIKKEIDRRTVTNSTP